MHTLYDERYAASGWIVQFLAAGLWFSSLSQMNHVALLAVGDSRWSAALNAYKLVALCRIHPDWMASMGISRRRCRNFIGRSDSILRQHNCNEKACRSGIGTRFSLHGVRDRNCDWRTASLRLAAASLMAHAADLHRNSQCSERCMGSPDSFQQPCNSIEGTKPKEPTPRPFRSRLRSTKALALSKQEEESCPWLSRPTAPKIPTSRSCTLETSVCNSNPDPFSLFFRHITIHIILHESRSSPWTPCWWIDLKAESYRSQ